MFVTYMWLYITERVAHLFLHKTTKHSYMKGTITTLIVGIVIGMLIAPEKGSVLRQKIVDLMDDLSEAGHHLAEKPDTTGLSGDLS